MALVASKNLPGSGLLLQFGQIGTFNPSPESIPVNVILDETACKSPRNLYKLIVDHLPPRDGTAVGDHVAAPLKDEHEIPKDEDAQDKRNDAE